MLDAQALSKSYGGTRVVTDLSLQLKAGEIVGLLGPNGAGKSTTVAMLCGLVTPDSGQVRIGAGSTAVMGAGNPALKRRIGLVPQDLALHEDLSAEANLGLFGALYGWAARTCASGWVPRSIWSAWPGGHATSRPPSAAA